MSNQALIDKLSREHNLSFSEWVRLLTAPTQEDVTYAGDLARPLTLKLFGRQIFFRGIIEFTNLCRNDCKYCGIRCSNQKVSRYRLTPEDILTCCEEGYALGYRTFVLQGGEDDWYNDDRITALIKSIRQAYPDCAITLSIGEKERASYQRFYDAGADRYLLRHETADEAHYKLLHPASLSWKRALRKSPVSLRNQRRRRKRKSSSSRPTGTAKRTSTSYTTKESDSKRPTRRWTAESRRRKLTIVQIIKKIHHLFAPPWRR